MTTKSIRILNSVFIRFWRMTISICCSTNRKIMDDWVLNMGNHFLINYWPCSATPTQRLRCTTRSLLCYSQVINSHTFIPTVSVRLCMHPYFPHPWNHAFLLFAILSPVSRNSSFNNFISGGNIWIPKIVTNAINDLSRTDLNRV